MKITKRKFLIFIAIIILFTLFTKNFAAFSQHINIKKDCIAKIISFIQIEKTGKSTFKKGEQNGFVYNSECFIALSFKGANRSQYLITDNNISIKKILHYYSDNRILSKYIFDEQIDIIMFSENNILNTEYFVLSNKNERNFM